MGSNKLLNLGDNINWEYAGFDVELPMWKPWFDSGEELNVISLFSAELVCKSNVGGGL